MAPVRTFWPTYLVVLATTTPSSSAWTLLWRNDTVPARIENGQAAQDCTQIWHEEGKEFSFDPEGPWCLKFYSDRTCRTTNGITCEGRMWRQVASQNISAYIVYPMPPASRTAFGFDSTTSSETPSPTSTSSSSASSPTSTPTPTPSNDHAETHASTTLSPGAIAGIVVGVVIAVTLLCALSFYLGRKSRRKSSSTPPPTQKTHPDANSEPAPSSSSPPPSTSPTMYSSSAATGPAELPKPPPLPAVDGTSIPQITYVQHPAGARMVELPGQNAEAELSNTRQVQELEGRW